MTAANNEPKRPPQYFKECFFCGEGIYRGDRYRKIGEDFYHEKCFKKDAADILEDKFGIVCKIAGSAK